MEAFEREALPHRAALEELAVHPTRDLDEADDLVQETYCKALRYWHTYRLGTNCRAWLFRLCRNEFVRGWRRGDPHDRLSYGRLIRRGRGYPDQDAPKVPAAAVSSPGGLSLSGHREHLGLA